MDTKTEPVKHAPPPGAEWSIWYEDGGQGSMEAFVLHGPVENRHPRRVGDGWEPCVVVTDDEPIVPADTWAWEHLPPEKVKVTPIYDERPITGDCPECGHPWAAHTPSWCMGSTSASCRCKHRPDPPETSTDGEGEK